MKPFMAVLLGLLLWMQYELWFAPGGVARAWTLNQAISDVKQDNDRIKAGNDVLMADVKDLKQGDESVEEYARQELGMVKKGETFYRIVPEAKNQEPGFKE